MQQSQCPHAPEDDRVISHHVADHVTDAQPCATQAASAYLGLEGSNPCFPFLLALFRFLMPLPLHRTVVPRPCLIPNWRPCLGGPVPHSSRDPLSLHADSRCSSLTFWPCVLMSYEAQRLGVSFLYR